MSLVAGPAGLAAVVQPPCGWSRLVGAASRGLLVGTGFAQLRHRVLAVWGRRPRARRSCRTSTSRSRPPRTRWRRCSAWSSARSATRPRPRWVVHRVPRARRARLRSPTSSARAGSARAAGALAAAIVITRRRSSASACARTSTSRTSRSCSGRSLAEAQAAEGGRAGRSSGSPSPACCDPRRGCSRSRTWPTSPARRAQPRPLAARGRRARRSGSPPTVVDRRPAVVAHRHARRRGGARARDRPAERARSRRRAGSARSCASRCCSRAVAGGVLVLAFLRGPRCACRSPPASPRSPRSACSPPPGCRSSAATCCCPPRCSRSCAGAGAFGWLRAPARPSVADAGRDRRHRGARSCSSRSYPPRSTASVSCAARWPPSARSATTCTRSPSEPVDADGAAGRRPEPPAGAAARAVDRPRAGGHRLRPARADPRAATTSTPPPSASCATSRSTRATRGASPPPCRPASPRSPPTARGCSTSAAGAACAAPGRRGPPPPLGGGGRPWRRKWTVHPSVEVGLRGLTAVLRLRPGDPAAPAGDRLRLLPSGPDLVHGPTSRGTRPSTPRAARWPGAVPLGREFGPARADCGCRAPLPPRLARSRKHGSRPSVAGSPWPSRPHAASSPGCRPGRRGRGESSPRRAPTGHPSAR